MRIVLSIVAALVFGVATLKLAPLVAAGGVGGGVALAPFFTCLGFTGVFVILAIPPGTRAVPINNAPQTHARNGKPTLPPLPTHARNGKPIR